MVSNNSYCFIIFLFPFNLIVKSTFFMAKSSYRRCFYDGN
nr:MAG TPA: hypothetical protein [Caudoviricetes sp.]